MLKEDAITVGTRKPQKNATADEVRTNRVRRDDSERRHVIEEAAPLVKVNNQNRAGPAGAIRQSVICLRLKAPALAKMRIPPNLLRQRRFSSFIKANCKSGEITENATGGKTRRIPADSVDTGT